MLAPKCGDGVLLDSGKSARVGHGVVGHDLASDSAHMLRAVAQTLHFLQRLWVPHGDIKPSNVCLSYEAEWPCILKLVG